MPKPIGRGRRYQRRRRAVLVREPLCRACKQRLAEQVDHVVPKHRGGTDDPANLQPLCIPCHRRKTRREAWSHKPAERKPTPKTVHLDGRPLTE